MARRVKITTPSGDVYRFDAVFNQNITSRLVITQYPVEDGSPITDHVYKEPETLSLSVAVSDVKLSTADNSFDGVNSRGEEAERILTSWQENALLLKVQTKFKLIENMILESVNTVIDNSVNANTLTAVLTFRKVRIPVVEETTAGPFPNETVAAFESEYQNNGDVQGDTITDAVVDVAGATIGGSIAGAAIGAALGGIVGSIVPGAGTIAGAIAGAKIGAIVGGSTGFITKTWQKVSGFFGGGS